MNDSQRDYEYYEPKNYDYVEREGDIYVKIYRFSNDINVLLEFLTIFINIAHLTVLLQKELRANSIFKLMIGICIADILGFLAAFHEHGMERNWFDGFPNTLTNCLRMDYGPIDLLPTLYFLIEMASRPISVWLAILMAMIRTLSVIFPMSTWIQKLTKSRTTILMVFIVFFFWTIYYSWHFIYIERLWYPDYLDPNCMDIEISMNTTIHIFALGRDVQEWETKRNKYEYLIKMIPVVFYPILTISLFMELRRIKKRRVKINKSENEKSDNTTKLILFMTIIFMLSEGLAGVSNFISTLINKWGEEYSELVLIMATASYTINNFRSINALSHAFVCFAMSSQYRDTVKGMCCFVCKPKMKATMVKGLNQSSGSRVFKKTKTF